jgi:hypothetical protein
VHVRNVGLAAGLGALALDAARRRASGGAGWWMLAGALIPLAARTWVNVTFWGTWLTNPHVRPDWSIGVVEAARQAVDRLGGLLLDQEHGLLPFAPIYLTIVAGLILLRRLAPAHARAAALLIAAYLVPVLCPWVNVHGWSGGWSPAARNLVPVVPFLAIAAFGLAMRVDLRLAALLAVGQVAIFQLLWRDPRLMWNDGDGRSEYLAAVSERLVAWWPAWASGGGGAAVTVVFLAAWVAVSVALTRRMTTD